MLIIIYIRTGSCASAFARQCQCERSINNTTQCALNWSISLHLRDVHVCVVYYETS